MATKKIIALFGWKGSGKDTVAEMIESLDYDNIYHYSFAEPIYDIAKTIFPDMRRTGAFSDENKNKPNRILSQIYKKRGTTGRDFIIKLGENMKALVNENVWAKNMCSRIKETTFDHFNAGDEHDLTFIVSDVRYKNEIKALKDMEKHGYEVVFYAVMRREAIPEWVKHDLNPSVPEELEIIQKDFGADRSEYEWVACNPSIRAMITNDGTMEELRATVENIFGKRA